DFNTGKLFEGGQTIQADAPLTQMPLFVKAGSIVPSGPDIQTVYEKLDAPITLNVYTGADGQYTLYNDDGKTYRYEQGEFSAIPIAYDDTSGTLTIGSRQGEFDGMVKQRTFHIHWFDGDENADSPSKLDVTTHQSVLYDGTTIRIKREN